MRKITSLSIMGLIKLLFTLTCILLLSNSCTRELSYEGPLPAGPISIFTTQIPANGTYNDGTGGIELGVRFRSTVGGNAVGIRFYKTMGNVGTHSAQLYSFDGELLASADFTNETDTGWQSVFFAIPISIAPNTTYIAAYFSSLGNYTATNFGLNTAVTNGPLIALADGADGINGLYKYSNTPAFPGQGHLSNNYWVDILVSGNTGE